MSEDIWKDPGVTSALKYGRTPDDIAVLHCPKCGLLGYYNQGSHFSCRHCGETWYCCSEDEDPPDDIKWMRLEDHLTLADASDAQEGP